MIKKNKFDNFLSKNWKTMTKKHEKLKSWHISWVKNIKNDKKKQIWQLFI